MKYKVLNHEPSISMAVPDVPFLFIELLGLPVVGL